MFSDKYPLSIVVVCFGFVVCMTGCGGTTSSAGTQIPPSYLFSAGSGATWLQEFGGAGFPSFPSSALPPTQQTIVSMAGTPSGNVVAGGYTLGSLNGAPNTGHVAENFLISYSATGQMLWSQQFGTGSGDFLSGVAVDQSGNIFADGITLGSFPGVSNSASTLEAAVYRFDKNGTMVWQKEFAVDGADTSVRSIALDITGNILLSGTYTEASNAGTSDLYFAKLDPQTGNTIWLTRYGTHAMDFLSSMTADSQGNIYASGSTGGTFPGTAGGADTNFIARINSATGGLDWTIVPADPGRPILVLLGMSARNGALLVGGGSSEAGPLHGVSVSFGPSPTARAFSAEYSTSDGSLRWAKSFSTGLGDEITSTAFLPSGQIVAAGGTEGVFAPGFTAATNNVFLFTLSPDGSPVSAVQLGTGPIINQSAPVGTQLTVGPTGDVFIGGPVQQAYPGFTNPSTIPQMFLAHFTR